MNVNGTEVLFEVDEERAYRAYIDPTNKEAIDKADKELLQASNYWSIRINTQ